MKILPRGVLACLVILPLAASAQRVTITVDATQAIRTVDERVFGANAVIWDPQAASAQTIGLLQTAGLRVVRVPGGSLSDEYHWATNTTLANTWTWASHFGSFVQLISGLNAQAFVTVNYGTGTPEEAAALVAYLNSPATLQGTTGDVRIGPDSRFVEWRTAGFWSAIRAAAPLPTDDGRNFLRLSRSAPVNAKYWEIGNENYGAWETDEQAVPHDPYTYAVRAASYFQRMKAVDPSIKVGVVAVTGETSYANYTDHPVTNPRTGAVRNGWTPVMLATLKAQGVTPDFIAYHRYEQQPGQENDAALLQAARTWSEDAADLRQQLNDYLGSAEAAKVEIVVTENNSVSSDPGKQTTSIVNALYLADSVGNVLQTEINALVWWDIRNGTPTNAGQIIGNLSPALRGWRNYGDYGILSTPNGAGATTYFEPYPTYYAFKLLSNFARGGDTVVRATSLSSLLGVFAAKRSNGTLAVLVINKDPVNTLQGDISVAGFTPVSSASVYSYGPAQDEAARSGGSGSTDIASSTLSGVGTTFTASFSPYSMTVLVMSPTTTPTNPNNPTNPTTPTVPPPPTVPPAPVVPPAPTVPTAPTVPPPAIPTSGSGGGGGAPSAWFVGALLSVLVTRMLVKRRG